MGLGTGQLGDQREGKRGSLTGTRLGDADDVGSFQDSRNRRQLDGRGNGITLVGNGLQDSGVEAERFK